eukprot:gnl/TRDRNA2_/TRDRNA2_174148_c0_seq4.p1 gnl/TRDRNA2_/TRDRNA2_174148_c0~~gnl/TRDRNA2_/TRDRNA2_174148_c0_seq4.p1  ORF type:complete len:498 (-),score=27.90 gnl/TRDRNA2_/TRDRNA2_174148_c0_seq4:169-1662(-)
MSESVAAGQERILDDVVDDLGVGCAQYRLLISGGGAYFLSGSIKLSISVMAVVLADAWGLARTQQAALVSMLFAGQMVGTLCAGFVADRYGRKTSLLIAIIVATLLSAASIFAREFWAMLAWRTGVGFSLGFATGPFNAISSEMSPSTRRPEMFALGNVMYGLGMMYCLLVVIVQDPDMEDLKWKLLTLLSVLPGCAFAALAWFWLLESVHFLNRTSSRVHVINQLEQMRSWNMRLEIDVQTWSTHEQEQGRDPGWGMLWSRNLRLTTVTLCLSTLMLNYVYYGQMYALPQVLRGVHLGFPPSGVLMIAVAVEIAGCGIGVILGRLATRKGIFVICWISAAICQATFVVAHGFLPEEEKDVRLKHVGLMVVALLSLCATRMLLAILFLFVYLYSAEVYPTSCRASGSAIAAAFGRLGSISCPFIFEASYQATGGYLVFFLLGVLVSVVIAIMFAILPLETKDRRLSDIAAESSPISCGCAQKLSAQTKDWASLVSDP